MDLMGLGVVLLALALLVWAILWFARKHYEDQSRWENEDFVQLALRYESYIERLEKERKFPDLMAKLIEASNANTKAVDLMEHTLNQLVLRQVGFQDRATRQYQTGERPEPVTVGNRTVLKPGPTTRMESGEEGFVDETSGKVEPLHEPTPRELAATPPT